MPSPISGARYRRRACSQLDTVERMTEANRRDLDELAPDGSQSVGSALDRIRWGAVTGHDRTKDGQFVYAIVTTRIYCRPGCGSRASHRENVRFFTDGTEARKDGYRACKRCLTDETPDWATRTLSVSRMCRLMENSSLTPTLAQLAQSVGYSPFTRTECFLRSLVSPRARTQSPPGRPR
ncbi:MAG: hypothetical protein EXR45_07200 [Chloroflexi bacterium]|nr:hypothetical protein [Chloroflexota bacterium]